MKDRLPALIALFILLGLVLVTWWATGYIQRAIPIEPPANITHEPDAWSDTFSMVSTNKQGYVSSIINGSSLRHYPDDDSYEIDKAEVTGQQTNAPLLVGSAKLATILNDGDYILLQGNAHIHRAATEKESALDIHSEELTILPQEDIVSTDKPAQIQQGDSQMRGKGMHYNNNTRVLNVFHHSNVNLSPTDIKKTQPNKGSQP